MIEEKVASGEDFLDEDTNIENTKYRVDSLTERNNYNKEYKSHYKIHLREIFYKFRGRHIFPDRG